MEKNVYNLEFDVAAGKAMINYKVQGFYIPVLYSLVPAELSSSIDEVGVIESISVTKQGTIISGHARKEKFDEKGLVPKEITLAENEYPVIVRNDIEDDTDTYYKAQILANTTAHQNYNIDFEDVEAIAEEYEFELEELGIEIEAEDADTFETEGVVKYKKGILLDKFIVPPISVLNTRQSYWQRKKDW